MVTSASYINAVINIKKTVKLGIFCLPGIRKDTDTKTLELSKERRRVSLTRINRPSDNLSEAQHAEVNSTIRVCGKHY